MEEVFEPAGVRCVRGTIMPAGTYMALSAEPLYMDPASSFT